MPVKSHDDIVAPEKVAESLRKMLTGWGMVNDDATSEGIPASPPARQRDDDNNRKRRRHDSDVGSEDN